MSAELIVRSELPPISWEEFVETHPVGSIALDGYVHGGPRFDREGPYWNANHHEEVSRLDTLSTAQQVLMHIKMGRDKPYSRSGRFEANVYVNDCDQDVCAAWYLLNHLEQTKSKSYPNLGRFIMVAGTMDVTAGAFPYDSDLEILEEQAWVFEPYTMFRVSGEMAKKDNSQYRSVIQSVEARIQQHLMGRGNKVALDTKYNRIGGGKGWIMIEEVGKDGKMGALMDGHDAMAIVQELPDDHRRVTLLRRSEDIPFEISEIVEDLNQAEGCTDDKWGGSENVAGSPRVKATKLSVAEIERIVNEHQAKVA